MEDRVPSKPEHVTDAELAILKLLWDKGTLTARQICEALYPEGTASDQATVHKLVQRLEAKDLIARDRSSFAHVFSAKAQRNELAGQQLEELAARLTKGSMVPLIMHAVDSSRLTASERRELRDLLDGKPRKR
jgi:predicted transcriptional regulator